MSAVSFQDLKDSLNITSSVNDGELADMLDEATTAVENLVGPLDAQSVTEEFDDHGWHIVLSKTPVLSVESVSIEPWLGADPIDDTAAWRLNRTTGVLRRVVVGGAYPFIGTGSIFTVTYTAGRAAVPAPVRRAVLMQAGELWKTQRAAASPRSARGGGDAPQPYQGSQGFLGPDVMTLLTPYLTAPGAA